MMQGTGEIFGWIFLISGSLLALSDILLGFFKKTYPPEKNTCPPFTIIVAAKDEETNLKELLPLLLKQDYPEFSILLVLDRCRDQSRALAEEFAQRDPKLKYLLQEEVPEGWSPKKAALTQAINLAQTEWLAFTDADCRPPLNWLKTFSEHISPGTEVIAGLSPYFRRPGMLNRFIRFETARTSLFFQGLAEWGWPYMALGRNLAYRKTFFEKAGGFSAHRAVLSGDDDLLIAQNANSEHLRICSGNPVYSLPKETFRDWKNQKIRHLSASAQYPFRRAWLPGLLNLSHTIFYLSLFVSAITGAFGWAQAGILLARYVGGIFSLKARNKTMETDLGIFFPLMDFLMGCYHLALFPISLLRKPEWKNDQKRH